MCMSPTFVPTLKSWEADWISWPTFLRVALAAADLGQARHCIHAAVFQCHRAPNGKGHRLGPAVLGGLVDKRLE